MHGYSLGSVLDHISKHFASSLRKLALGVVGSPNIKDSPEPYFLPNLKELTLKDTMPINILQHFSASPVRTLNFVRSPHCEWHEFRKYILAKDTLPFLEHLDLQAARFGPSPTKEDWEAFEKEFVQAHKVVKITSPRLQSVRTTTLFHVLGFLNNLDSDEVLMKRFTKLSTSVFCGPFASRIQKLHNAYTNNE